MLKKILFALMFVITAITNVTHAEDDMKTVASKAYVDTKIETKQLKIPAANTPGVGAGETVMTYTATGNGQIGERGLYSDISSYDATTDGDKLITASALNATFTNLPTTPTTKLECANQADGCTLWTIVDQTAYARGLPSGYTRLEYIQSTGTQYIDTGYFFTDIATETVTIDFMRTGTGAGSVLYGSRKGYRDNGYGIQFADSGNTYIQYGRIDSGIGGSAPGALNTRYTLIQTGPTYSFLDVSFTSTGSTPTQSYPLFLMTANNGGNPSLLTPMRVYGFNIKDSNDNIKLNLIPAKCNSDDVLGMYDTVSGTFFTNAASSGDDFTPGPAAN